MENAVKRPLREITNQCSAGRKASRERENCKNLTKTLERYRQNYANYEYWDVQISWQMLIRSRKTGKVECFKSPETNFNNQECAQIPDKSIIIFV